jgi:SAM-dependent methyltransferase
MPATLDAGAECAYDALAPVYDLLTGTYAYDRWLTALEDLAHEHGLAGRRLLDVACGTGKSFLPLLDRGYEVTACDVSAGMVALAAAKARGRAALHLADMRALPVLGRFDLITCLDDSLNHLLEPREVVETLAGIRANLAPGGLLLFDVNTRAAYAGAGDAVVEDGERLVAWRGSLAGLDAPGGEAEVLVEVFERAEGGLWRRSSSRHRHRHHPLDALTRWVRDAGLRVLDVRGQWPGAVLDTDVDEDRHPKAVFVCTNEEGGAA